MQLSAHFSLEEAIASQTAARKPGIDNYPPDDILQNMIHTAEKMEQVRQILGSYIEVSSWYRCPKLNKAVGGATKSAHMSGYAVDFNCRGFGNPFNVCRRLVEFREFLRYDQLIHEYGNWVHISFDPKERMEELSIFSGTGYLRGILPVPAR
jgi:hypothetical protein